MSNGASKIIDKDRHEFLKSEVVGKGRDVKFDEVQKEFGVKEPTMYKDGDYFEKHGIPIYIEKKVFKPGHGRLTTISRRKTTNRAEKEAIGKIAAEIVLT